MLSPKDSPIWLFLPGKVNPSSAAPPQEVLGNRCSKPPQDVIARDPALREPRSAGPWQSPGPPAGKLALFCRIDVNNALKIPLFLVLFGRFLRFFAFLDAIGQKVAFFGLFSRFFCPARVLSPLRLAVNHELWTARVRLLTNRPAF